MTHKETLLKSLDDLPSVADEEAARARYLASVKGTIAPAGRCGYCDNRRAVNLAAAVKHRAKRKAEKEGKS